MKEKYSVFPLLGLAALVVLSGFLLETAFQLSKFSFLSNLSALDIALTSINSLGLLLIAILVAALALRMVLSVLWRQARLCGFIFKAVQTLLCIAFTAVVFAHIDTWTYTTFKHDVGSLPFLVNIFVLFALVFVGVAIAIKHGERISQAVSARKKMFVLALAAFALLFAVSIGYNGATKFPHLSASLKSGKALKDLPNIIIVVPDGVPTSHLSTYGYERQTSPNLDFVAGRSLLFKRAYTNSGSSRASITSILTGKSPATTKVIYAPDILVGKHSFEHLPGILADLGYFCLTIGDGMHVSPGKINFQLAFHSENGEMTGLRPGSVMHSRVRRFFNLELYYLTETLTRITNRLGYMAGLSEELVRFRHLMQDFAGLFADLRSLPHYSVEDQHLMRFFEQIKSQERPIFAYLHLNRTHGPQFPGLVKQKFSEGEQTPGRDPDFFDDAILTTDYIYALIINTLQRTGKLQSTMILYLTDHGTRYNTEVPLPLVVHLPGQESKIEINDPVQYMDIAPSILEFLGLGIPEWMEGEPVFMRRDSRYLAGRPIISLTSSHMAREGWMVRALPGPPLYGIGKVSLLREGHLYTMNLGTEQEALYDVSATPNEPRRITDLETATKSRQMLQGYLKEKGIGTIEDVIKENNN